MIVARVEIVSANGSNRDRILGEVRIENKSGTDAVGNYHITVAHTDGRIVKVAQICGFPRERFGGWELLALAMSEAFAKELSDAKEACAHHLMRQRVLAELLELELRGKLEKGTVEALT